MLSKAKVKYIQTLGQKKYRDNDRVFIAEGPKIVAELLAAIPAAVLQVYALKEWIDDNRNALVNKENYEISEAELERISQLTTPNKVLAIVKMFDAGAIIGVKGKITLVLDAIRDPGNMGTIIRNADWFGVELIICSHDCADVYNPKVVQATMGSIARVKLFYTDVKEWLGRQKDISVYAAAMEGKDITTLKKLQEGIILIGSESRGIQPGIMELANVKITIPKKGKADSLNAAVATGIILSHVC